jgi:hypothetical protein
MMPLFRIVHVLSIALWFGSVAFFSVAGLLIFQAFADESRLPSDQRPLWFPVRAEFDQPSPGAGFPDPIRLEQGSRAAGLAVSRIFPIFYGMQVCCGIVAWLTALALARSGTGSAHGWRSWLCLLALLTALGGWLLERRVSDLRVPRNELTDRVLSSSSPKPELVEQAREARATFGRWHGYSLMQNFATLILVASVTVLVPALSDRRT